jgi:DNA-binding transcriptional ArsR family regulator
MIGFYYTVLPEKSWSSFPAYLDHMASVDPVTLRDKLLNSYANLPWCNPEFESEPIPLDKEAVLSSAEAYLEFLMECFGSGHIDTELETQAYHYAIDPPAMQSLIVSHLREMWQQYLAPEWERVQPMLAECVGAFEQIDFKDMSKLEAAQIITDQDMSDSHWSEMIQNKELVFVPSAHISPYTGGFPVGDTLYITFGARLPKGTQVYAPDLSRTEILVRLTALADDNRLRILKFVSDKGEQRSQEIMEHLDLSQSASSRHLKQLSATGFLVERRCNGAKCYELNSARLDDTLQAVGTFLLGT